MGSGFRRAVVGAAVLSRCSSSCLAWVLVSGARECSGTWAFGQGQAVTPSSYWAIRRFASSSGQSGAEVDAELVKKTAGLAMLEVTQEEAEGMVGHFKDFLKFVDTMREVEGKGGLPVELRDGDKAVTSSFGGFLREDNPVAFQGTGDILDNMPQEKDGYLVVPKVGAEAD